MDRRLCPSCQTRLSPLAMECPNCGLVFTRAERPRPLLFQASGLKREPGTPRDVALPPMEHSFHPLDLLDSALHTLEPDPSTASFGPLLLAEAGEACLLAALNLGLALALSLVLQAPVSRIFAEDWPVVLPAHLLVSWTFLMVPLVVAGQSPLMGRWNLVLAEDEPERRMVFSLLHLVSVALFPLSFLCMILSPRHQTLAEYLSGQEIISKPEPRMR